MGVQFVAAVVVVAVGVVEGGATLVVACCSCSRWWWGHLGIWHGLLWVRWWWWWVSLLQKTWMRDRQRFWSFESIDGHHWEALAEARV